MELSKYIKEILISKDSVIIAGFGAFEKIFNSAKIDPVTGEMFPPQATVIFRPELKIDSGILIKYIAEKDNISEEAASELIKNQVAEWESTLQAGQMVVLSELGNLSRDQNGQYEFIPTIQPSDFPESYGLPVISIQEKSGIIPPPTKKEEPKIPTEKKQVEKKIVDKKSPIKKTPEKTSEKIKSPVDTKISKKLIIGLAIGIPVAAIIVLGALNFNLVKQKFNDASHYISGLASGKDSAAVSDTTARVSDTVVTSELENEAEALLENYTIVNAETNTQLDPKTEKLGNIKKFYIIAGSYKNKNYANRQRNLLNKKGFQAEVLPLNNGLYRVSVASFTDIQSASDDFERIKSIDENLNVWILVNK